MRTPGAHGFRLEHSPVKLPKRKPRPGPEAGILHAVLRAIALHPSVAWARRMNSGAFKSGDGKSARYVRFGFVGCPDILGQMRDGRLLAIECKGQKGRVTVPQEAFLGIVAQHGGVAGVARSIDDALRIVGGGR